MVKKVEVLGSGCPKCKQTIKILEMAIKELGLEIDVEKVQDIEEIIKRGIVATPAVAINEKVILSGKIPTLDEAKQLLQNA
ncbi:MAG: thioredoxin family protein [Fervidobacterium sp.]